MTNTDHFEKYIPSYIRQWKQELSSDPLCDIPKYSFIQQTVKYFRLKKQLAKVFDLIEQTPKDTLQNLFVHPEIKKLAQLLTDQNLSGVDSLIDSSVRNKFFDCSEKFIHRATSRWPDMESSSLNQALRNVWIMNMLQITLEKDLQLTDSIFAYSMLYPLTDNLMDDPSISSETKKRFVYLLEQKLLGKNPVPGNIVERDVFEMIELIEKQFDRQTYPQIYESLLFIHRAQQDSLHQQYENLPQDTLLELTFRKGAASVIADGCLVAGELSDRQLHFLTGYGIVLQLADDLQDLVSDRLENHRTVFNTVSAGERVLLTKKLLLLSQYVSRIFAAENPRFFQSTTASLYQLIHPLILNAVYENKREYPPFFIRFLGRTCPIGLSFYYKNIKKLILSRSESNSLISL